MHSAQQNNPTHRTMPMMRPSSRLQFLIILISLLFTAPLSAPHAFAQASTELSPATHISKRIANTINNINFMTEQYPPFNYMENGKLKGISIELFDAILHDMGGIAISSKNVRHLPWARAYKTVLQEPASCLFVMTRTPSRENLFKWVGPIMPTTIAVIARKDKHFSIHTQEDLKHLSIAALQNDIGQTLLIEAGYPAEKISINPYATGIIEMMNKNRLDAWAYEESVAKFFIRQEGYKTNDFERLFTLEQSYLFFAFNINTPDEIITAFQKTFAEIAARGDLERIIHRYVQ